tara:strand:- start:12 stop:716 length:705 start_codon:yes stop_codon:yes gene_type:complete
MTINNKNQNDIVDFKLIKSFEIEEIFNDRPINRLKNKLKVENKLNSLNNLKSKIEKIENCKLKNNASQIVFNDGDHNSQIMLIGEGPGEKEDKIGKPFVGDAGILLNKMLNAINIKRSKIYITNVVNFRPPNNRKPNSDEVAKYSNFLIEHISIVSPKILILMGSTAMESLVGNNIKISNERGKWKEIIIKNKTYLSIITFHPAYLLRQPDQKKYSWHDLKEIKNKIDELNIKI